MRKIWLGMVNYEENIWLGMVNYEENMVRNG